MLCLYAKFNKDLENKNTHQKIHDQVNAIFSLRKQETEDFTKWLRNRTFDLLALYFADKMTLKASQRKSVYVTSDKVIAEFFFYLFFLFWY